VLHGVAVVILMAVLTEIAGNNGSLAVIVDGIYLFGLTQLECSKRVNKVAQLLTR